MSPHVPETMEKDPRGKDKCFFKAGYFFKNHYSLFHTKSLSPAIPKVREHGSGENPQTER